MHQISVFQLGLLSLNPALELPPISFSSHVLESFRDRSCHQKSTDKAKKKHRQGDGGGVLRDPEGFGRGSL